MKRNDTKLLSIAFGLIVMSTALVMLALSTLSGLAQSEDDWYPAPIDYGYPIGYPGDYGYPIYDPYPVIGYPIIEPYPIEYGYPVEVGYPIVDGYPDPLYPEPVSDTYKLETVSEPTFAKEWQAEIEEVKEVIENIQPFEKSKVYQTWQQVKAIVRHYVGKMLMFAR